MILLNRIVDYGTPENGTLGTLTFGNFFCYTIERPWADNKPSYSCIPPGDYFLEKHQSPSFGNVAIIYGNTVSKYPQQGFDRNLILIHPANTSSDLAGCIGLGDSIGKLNGVNAVLNSRKTVTEFLSLINNDVYNFRIRYPE